MCLARSRPTVLTWFMGRLLEWALTPPLWHAEAVGGVHTIRPPHLAAARNACSRAALAQQSRLTRIGRYAVKNLLKNPLMALAIAMLPTPAQAQQPILIKFSH